MIMIHVITNATENFILKLLWIAYPKMDYFEMLFLKQFICLFLLVPFSMGRIKFIFYDCVPPSMIVPLAIRTFSGTASFLLVFYAVMTLPIFLVSLIVNTGPIFTSIMAVIFLKEQLKMIEVVFMVIAFSGVIVMVISGKERDDSTSGSWQLDLIPFLMLLLAPIMMAITNVLLRHMRGLHELTSAAYLVVASTLISLVGLKL